MKVGKTDWSWLHKGKGIQYAIKNLGDVNLSVFERLPGLVMH